MIQSKNVSYASNTCNIGPNERTKRFLFGSISLIAGVAIWLAFKNTPLTFITTSLGFLGLVQARSGFCVMHGFKNTQNLDEGEKKLLAQYAAKNKTQAVLICALSALTGILFTFILIKLIP